MDEKCKGLCRLVLMKSFVKFLHKDDKGGVVVSHWERKLNSGTAGQIDHGFEGGKCDEVESFEARTET